MAQVLRNFKRLRTSYHEFPYIDIKENQDVFVEQPICICEYDYFYTKPMLLVDGQGRNIAVDESYIMQLIDTTKVFHFALEAEGPKVKEVPETDAFLHIRLPKDTDVSQLMFVNGQIVRARPVGKDDPVAPVPDNSKGD